MIIEFEEKKPVVADDVFVAPTAAIIGDVTIGEGSSVWFSAVIRGDYGPIKIGNGCSIQDSVVVHVNHSEDGSVSPTIIEDDCIVGHGAVIEGCRLGKSCLIGMNAVVLPKVTLGEGCVVAAGSVVKLGENIPPYSLLAGTPAIVKRTFDAPPDDIAWAASEYRELSNRYLSKAKIVDAQQKPA